MVIKIRQNVFETNSSSTHSLTICDSGDLMQTIPVNKDGSIVISSDNGKTEFGWEYEASDDVYSKVNYAYLQAFYLNQTKPEWMVMLENSIKEHTGAKEVFFSMGISEHGYIDHQSASYEGENIEMFNSEESLRNFLFNPSSYIQTDNDNR